MLRSAILRGACCLADLVGPLRQPMDTGAVPSPRFPKKKQAELRNGQMRGDRRRRPTFEGLRIRAESVSRQRAVSKGHQARLDSVIEPTGAAGHASGFMTISFGWTKPV